MPDDIAPGLLIQCRAGLPSPELVAAIKPIAFRFMCSELNLAALFPSFSQAPNCFLSQKLLYIYFFKYEENLFRHPLPKKDVWFENKIQSYY